LRSEGLRRHQLQCRDRSHAQWQAGDWRVRPPWLCPRAPGCQGGSGRRVQQQGRQARHLFPAYGLAKAGVDPDKDIKAIFAGSHTSSFEALYNKKVQAGELNSEQLESAKQRGHYKDGDFVFLWKSEPIPTDPISVRGDLPAGFKARLVNALQTLDLHGLDEKDRKVMGMHGLGFVPQTDKAYDGIRDLVKTLHIDLQKLS
jgi:phosphonate transport system substrate-binding protein